MRETLKLPRLIGVFTHQHDVFRLLQTTYDTTGRLAITIEKGHARHSRLSVNVPDIELQPDEFLAHLMDANEEFRAPLLGTGLFEDTGKRWEVGFHTYEVWKLHPHEETEQEP